MIRQLRVVRVLRVAVAVSRVLPRYLILLARDRSGLLPPRADDWQRAHAAAAGEIKRVALSLAGAFVKAAQILGARADFLPRPFIDELSQFHDAVPPRPFETLAPLVERDLGRPLDEVFASIEHEALAAASLAQVHRATLRDGSRVVVKIQYPEIRRIIPLDLGMLRRVIAIVQRLQSLIDLRALVTEVTRFIELELDFPREVRATERLAASLADFPEVVVPRVHRELCGERTIVLEYLEGIQVARTEALVAAGHKLSDVARKIGALYGSMIFEHDFFHGDPHPGNLLVLRDGRIGLLDFGLCKELPPGFAGLVAQMMVAAMIGDSASALAAADALGFDTRELKPENLRSLMLMTLGDSDTDAGLLEILGESRLRRIPEDFALVARTLVLLNGLSYRLAPGRRLIQAELIQHLAAGAASEASRAAASRALRPARSTQQPLESA
jgi:ubiquinone biosynthesis protein